MVEGLARSWTSERYDISALVEVYVSKLIHSILTANYGNIPNEGMNLIIHYSGCMLPIIHQ